MFAKRRYPPTRQGIEKRSQDLKKELMKYDYMYGTDLSKIINTGGSNFNVDEAATPPHLQWSVYWNNDSSPEQRKRFEKILKEKYDFKVTKRWHGGTNDVGGIEVQDKDLQPTNENWKKLGFSEKEHTKLFGVNTWDKKGRQLGHPDFGR